MCLIVSDIDFCLLLLIPLPLDKIRTDRDGSCPLHGVPECTWSHAHAHILYQIDGGLSQFRRTGGDRKDRAIFNSVLLWYSQRLGSGK